MARRRKPVAHQTKRRRKTTKRPYRMLIDLRTGKPSYMSKRRWMKKATNGMKKGTLHVMLGIPLHRKISTARLRAEIKHAKSQIKLIEQGWRSRGGTKAHWKKLRARAQMALNFRKKSKR